MAGIGSGPVTRFPAPGGYIVEGDEKGREPSHDEDEDLALDSRIRWSDATFGRLRSRRQKITAEMERNRDLYDGEQWTRFGSGKRPPWKLAATLNYCRFVVDHKAAVLSDNKPRVTYSTTKREDDWQAEIMSAAFDDFYETESVQRKIEDAIKIAGIQKTAWLRPTYDPLRNNARGGARLDVVPGMAVYLNPEATCVADATHLCYEYTMPKGEVLTRWRHLRGKPLTRAADSDRTEDHDDRPQPATSFTNAQGVTSHYGPYSAPTSSVESGLGDRILIREWWTRPYGPKAETTVDAMVFTAAGEVQATTKMIELTDGRTEPLQTVVTEGNIVYELPMSIAVLLQWAAGIGGLKVYSVEDAMEVQTRERRVPLYPNGRRMVVAGRQVADDGANPNASGRWPFIPLQSNRDGFSLHAKCDIDLIASLQDAINRIVSMIFDSAHLMSNPIWRLPLNSDVSDEALSNAPGAIIREDVNSLRYGKRESGVEIPSYIMAYVGFLIAQLKELVGLTDSAVGQKGKTQQSAETTTMFQEAANIRNRPGIRNIEQACCELGDIFRGIVSQFYTEEKMVRVKDQAGVERHVPFIGTYLNADMSMKARAGSGLPQSPSARLQLTLQLLNTPAMDIPEVLRQLEEVGLIESAASHLKRLMREKNDPRLAWLIPALNGPPGKGGKKNSTRGRSTRANTPGSMAARR